MSQLTETRRFIQREWRFLLFGLLLSFWSSPGQTFVISLFGGHIRSDFDLTHGEFGTIYTCATLISAALLWKTGPLVDHLPLKKFVQQAATIMIISIALVAGVQGPITLFFGIFFVRFMGQGMLHHIAMTAMARRYQKERGRAIAIAGLGFPIGESLFPPLVVLALGIYDWQLLWPVMAIFAAITLLPLIPKLIGHTSSQDGQGTSELAQFDEDARHWTRAEMLRDKRFFLLALTPIAQSGIITGVFFHQVHLISLKGWSMEWWSICFSIFAASSLIGGLLSGFLVDHFRARSVAPLVLLPLAIGLTLFAIADHPAFAAIIMAIFGFGAGANNPALSSLWAELYGVKHLGAIRSVANVVMVFGSALGPVFMGAALDAEISLQTLAYISAALAAGGAVACKIALKNS
ncbi:hypothetical protein A9Q83_04870 [Alphaproteobacteria bacterium 46_93_T64]|nr:hypothetical protein A9Q83_04870 [Alphaproteobacteria bacterium 46_93_T64]